MAIETLACSAAAAPDNWVLGAGASKVVAVALPDDDDTSYIRSTTTANTQQRFDLSDASAQITAADTIVGVRVTARCMAPSPTGSLLISIVLSGTTLDAPANISVTGAYTNLAQGFVQKPGGGSFALADINALQVQLKNTSTREIRCTSLTVEVIFTRPDRSVGSELLTVNDGL